ncbi:hypothetical protein [Leptospira brenneri]|uniref:hypothetical protein n=1 Tax=Leptospira brenneri TaxID=2023182 RepID=UPI001FCCA810|nr:hypothetical protein [Leptospira brenneri]
MFILILTYCSVGTNEEACKYYLERDYGNACLGLAIGYNFGEENAPSRAIGINYYLVNCYTYLKKKKECEREENQYLPGLYGMNLIVGSPDYIFRR